MYKYLLFLKQDVFVFLFFEEIYFIKNLFYQRTAKFNIKKKRIHFSERKLIANQFNITTIHLFNKNLKL